MLSDILNMTDSPQQREIIEILYCKYEQMLFRKAAVLLKNDRDSEDAVQDTFAWLIEHYFEIDFSSDQKTFALMSKVLQHKCIDKIRRRNTENIYIESVKGGDFAILDDFTETEVREFISRLPDDIMQVVALKYAGNYSAKEIAKRLRITQRTVFNRMAKAKEILKEYYKEYYKDD